MDEKNTLEAQKSSLERIIIIVLVLCIIFVIAAVFLVLFLSSLPKKISEEELSNGITIELKENQKAQLEMNGEKNKITIKSIGEDSVDIEIENKDSKNIKINEEKQFDLNNNGLLDLNIKLAEINNGKASLEIMKIEEPAPPEEDTLPTDTPPASTTNTTETTDATETKDEQIEPTSCDLNTTETIVNNDLKTNPYWNGLIDITLKNIDESNKSLTVFTSCAKKNNEDFKLVIGVGPSPYSGKCEILKRSYTFTGEC